MIGFRTGELDGNVHDFFNTGITEANFRVTRSLVNCENPVNLPFGPTRFIQNVGVQADIQLDLMTRQNLLRGELPS